tara:strand:+ start:1745 stop:1987 length:243 start_codon:yes stop_codon:yes gene_type:complete
MPSSAMALLESDKENVAANVATRGFKRIIESFLFVSITGYSSVANEVNSRAMNCYNRVFNLTFYQNSSKNQETVLLVWVY